jgi:hypothetical protein
MNHDPVQIVAKCLRDERLLSLPEDQKMWPGYEGFMPDEPDQAIALYDTSGLSTSRSMVTGARADKPGLQIKVRSLERKKAWQRIEAIRVFLNETVKRTEVVIGSDTYMIHSITQAGTVADLGQEPESRRFAFTLNIRASIT